LYLHVAETDINSVFEWLKSHKSLNDTDLDGCHYMYLGEQAVSHMMKVASGLDSMVLGEPQILGQLKQAFSIARSAGTMGTHLERLFQQSFSVAKTVRTETEIGSSAVSVAYAAVTLAKRLFSTLDNSTALFIGAGETIELAAKHFTDQANIQTIFANRTREKAAELAQQHQGEGISLSEIPGFLPRAEIIHKDDIPRFAELNVAAEMCPILWYPIPGLNWELWLGPHRSKVWPVKTLVESGALVIYGSDWPVVPTANPWPGIESMVTRSDPSGASDVQDWPEQAVDLATTIRIFTHNGAIANKVGNSSGSLETGKDADFIVLDRNIFEVPIADVGETVVLMTVVGGKSVVNKL